MKRRDFCKAAMVVPFIIPSSVLGKNAPSNRMNIASIGTGRMGFGDMRSCLYQGLDKNVRIVAVCDVDSKRAMAAKKTVDDIYAKELGQGKVDGVQVYSDYRKLLERKDIDGVTISTPDHWHALIAIAA